MAATEPQERGPAHPADRLAMWGSLLLGVLAIVIGVLLATRPLTSLQALALYLGVALMVLGVAELIGERTTSDGERTTWATVRAVVMVALGLLILLWLRHHFELLALVLAVALVLFGGRRLWQAGGGAGLTSIDRVATGLLGAAEVLIGVVAVRWPDLTLLVLAVLFAVRLVAFGIGRIRRAHDQWRHDSATTPGRRPAASWLRLVGGALALLLALGAGFLGVQARTGSPTVDAFYETPIPVPTQPGVLLRSEPFTRDVPDDTTVLGVPARPKSSPAAASSEE